MLPSSVPTRQSSVQYNNLEQPTTTKILSFHHWHTNQPTIAWTVPVPKNIHSCPIHPNWIGPTVGTDDRTQRKSGRQIFYALPKLEFWRGCGVKRDPVYLVLSVRRVMDTLININRGMTKLCMHVYLALSVRRSMETHIQTQADEKQNHTCMYTRSTR